MRHPNPTGLASVDSATLLGVTAHPIRIEVTTGRGPDLMTTAGLDDASIQPTGWRLRAAVTTAGYPWPTGRVTVSVRPFELPKQPDTLDVPIALALLAAAGTIPPEALDGLWALGTLTSHGDVGPVHGVLPAVQAARDAGASTVLVPTVNLPEALLVGGIRIGGIRSLAHAVGWLHGHDRLDSLAGPPQAAPADPFHALGNDLGDVHGQPAARRALEIAAAGGHPLLLTGPAGSPRTMLARHLAALLPDLTEPEALEITLVRSAAGLLDPAAPLARTRPFRAPHHSLSLPALLGGGSRLPRPGELSLAHHGVLYLDELTEYPRKALEALRQPLDEGATTLIRSQSSIRLPARFHLVAAATLSPDPDDPQRARTLHRLDRILSTALNHRIELCAPVAEHTGQPTSADPAETTATVRGRVLAARDRQQPRGHRNTGLPAFELASHCHPTGAAWKLAADTFAQQPQISTSALHTALRVARTIADLADADQVTGDHLTEALGLLPHTLTQEVPTHNQP